MFDLYGNDRLSEWRKLRESLENSQTPFDDVVALWCKAPFVSPYLDPYNCSNWPDPWKLVLDNKFDNLSIALGILYTLKLTQRFSDTEFKIHMSVSPKKSDSEFFVSAEEKFYLNFLYGTVTEACNTGENYRIIWTGNNLP